MTVQRTLLQERLISIVRRFPQRRILVIGDAVADQFIYGAISRVSREAPVFILRHEHTETVPGGAANCAVNLASLGANVSLVSVAGKDEAGKALIEKLNASGVDCSGVLTSDEMRTPTKVRILAGQVHSTRQQVIRIDYEGDALNSNELTEELRTRAREHLHTADAVIISDYNYGVADASMISLVREAAGRQKIPLLADSRFKLSEFASFTSATPNQDEVEKLFGKAVPVFNRSGNCGCTIARSVGLPRAADHTRRTGNDSLRGRCRPASYRRCRGLGACRRNRRRRHCDGYLCPRSRIRCVLSRCGSTRQLRRQRCGYEARYGVSHERRAGKLPDSFTCLTLLV